MLLKEAVKPVYRYAKHCFSEGKKSLSASTVD